MHRDPFAKVGPSLNRDLALISVGIVAAGALIGVAVGTVADVLWHRHRGTR